MIARIWRGTAAAESAHAYEGHFITRVVPHLIEIKGHKRACLLRTEKDGKVEFIALTLWESLDDVRAFTGPDATRAVVDAEAREVLERFDTFATNYEVVADSGAP